MGVHLHSMHWCAADCAMAYNCSEIHWKRRYLCFEIEQRHAMPCNAMQCNAMPCNAMQCHEMPVHLLNPVSCMSAQLIVWWHTTVMKFIGTVAPGRYLCFEIEQRHAMPCNAMQCHAMPCNAMQCQYTCLIQCHARVHSWLCDGVQL